MGSNVDFFYGQVIAGLLISLAGLAVGLVPDYVGSDEYTAGFAPMLKWHWNRKEFYVRVRATEVSVNLINSETWNAGPVLNYRFGREDVEDTAVDRMKTIEGAVEAGAFVSWSWINSSDRRQRFNTSLQLLHEVSGEHEGYQATVSARYFQPVSLAITLSLGASTSYASDGFMQTYFGVDAADSASSALPRYPAGGGLQEFRLSPMAIFSMSPQWHIGAGMIYSRLMGDGEDSPVVATCGSENQFMFGLGVVYAW